MDERYHRTAAQGDLMANTPVIVGALQLLGVFTVGVLSIVAVILAYVWKNDPRTPAWAVTHHRYHVRTFWYSIALAVVGALTMIIGVGFLILAVVGIYAAIRTILALMRAVHREPVPNPEAFLW